MQKKAIGSMRKHLSKNVVHSSRKAKTMRERSRLKSRSKNYQNSKKTNKNNISKVDQNAHVNFIPLGGLREIGKNCYAYEYKNTILVVDVGIAFPDEALPGVDVIIPDFEYLKQNREKVKGLLLTHGHEDHIGAITWFASEFSGVPIFGRPLTLKLVDFKLNDKYNRQNQVMPNADLRIVNCGEKLQIGDFRVEFIHVNHSIADSCALLLETEVGKIVHTGDFKVDYSPVHGEPINLGRFAELGNEGVLALVSESTNVDISGVTPSEQIVGRTFSELFNQISGRIIVATFASNIYRIQQLITAAEQHNRKVALLGRSMTNAFNAASELGYLTVRANTMVEPNKIGSIPPEELLLITTGTQGEELSALTRIAFAEHRLVKITQDDTVILSSSMIPGNEKSIYRVINELYKLGANVIYNRLADIHVSGHAYRDELKLMLNLVKPKFFIPMHGEFRHLFEHAKLAQEQNIASANIFLLSNGQTLKLTQSNALLGQQVPASGVVIDGSGIGDLNNNVLHDRLRLADDGVIALFLCVDSSKNCLYGEPQIQARGFLYESETEAIYQHCYRMVNRFVRNCQNNGDALYDALQKGILREQLRDLLYQQTRRHPVILLQTIQINER